MGRVPPHERVHMQSLDGCSSRVRGRTARCTPRRAGCGLSPASARSPRSSSYGVVQRRATLDHLIEALAGRPVDRLDAPVLAALRLGVFQLAFLERVPAHAAVGESVELAKADSPAGAGLVNAVLRRAAREARGRVAALPEATPAAGRAAPLVSRVDRGAVVRGAGRRPRRAR